MYKVLYSPPAGHTSPEITVGEAETLVEARDIVRRKLGVSRLMPGRFFCPPGAVEGWNERPPSHPEAEGCGAYLIVGEEGD